MLNCDSWTLRTVFHLAFADITQNYASTFPKLIRLMLLTLYGFFFGGMGPPSLYQPKLSEW
jgi:hypothetical protein